MDKKTLRNHAKQLRTELNDEELRAISEHIISRLTALSEFKNRRVVHLFYPIKEKREIDLTPLIKICWNQGKTVVLPRVSQNGKLTHHKLTSFAELESTKWGMKEPAFDTPQVEPSALDIIVVPMLMGDRRKHRLGYGAGFYDRFISEASGALTIGVVADQLLATTQLPNESHDEPLDLILTDQRLIK